jgi:hypothetical protein
MGRQSNELPRTISVTGDLHDQKHTLATATSLELFDVADDIADFNFLAVESSRTILMQIVIDDNATNGESYQVITLTANHPIFFSSDVALASDGSVDLFDGTSDKIERINVRNNSGSTAVIRVFAIT